MKTGEKKFDEFEELVLELDMARILFAEEEEEEEEEEARIVVSIKDITERKRVEEALHKALAQANEGKRILDALMEQVPEGITIADAPDVRIRMVSRYGRELTGKSKEILEGITVDKHTRQWDIYCADGVTPAKNEDLPLTRATQKGELVKDEEWVLGKQSGKRIPILCNAGPIRDDVGNIIGGVIAWRDITERKRAEEALRESQERFRTLYENSTVGLYRTTPDGRIHLANPALVRMLGYSSFDDLSTRNLEKNGFEPSYPRTQFVENIEKDGEVKGLESAWKRKDGTIIFVRESARAIRDSQAKTLYYDGTVEDITERKQAEEKLRESDQQYQTIGETIPYGVWLTDAIGYCTYVSKSFLELVDMTMEQVQEFGWLHLLPPEDVEPTKEHWLHCVQTGEYFEREHRFRTQDGSYRNILAIGRPIKDDTGKIAKWVGLNLDITERKKTEEEIRKKNAELKAFVDMLSHDLKNPVVSIQGFCSLLMKNHIKDLNEKALFYIQRMQANASLMTNLLGDLVELSRIGRIEDKKTKISIQEVIKSVWAGASTSLATQNVEFVSPENLPQLFYSEKRLYQIFYNLLSNALKFRDEERKTKVEIGHQEDKDNYIFFVRDNGIGIEQKYHNKIFDSFSQLKETKSEGTGMGLAIVKKIVEANQGKVWVESRKGAGSTFYFTIPKNVKS